jgi:maleylacetate reductase
MTEFVYNALPGHIVFGFGTARTSLIEVMNRFDTQRILLIATEREASLAAELCEPFADRVHASFTAVRPHVPVEVAQRARAAAAGADLILSIGGGSTTGTAKAVALTTHLPVVCVPTTFAGSEVTPVWGMTDNGRKATGTDARVLPHAVVYDPQMTASLPLELSVVSGLNAMAHCVEAFWAPRRNPLCSAIAEEGVRHLAAGLRAVTASPSDRGAHSALLLGAYLAGSAFAAAGSGLHHKICHALGGAFDLPHAQTHAVVLPHVVAYNAPNAPEALERLSRALGSQDAAAGLADLTRDLPVPMSLKAIGMPEAGVDDVLDEIVQIAPADNPTPITGKGVSGLLRAAWAGTTPGA